jgi:transposase
MASIRAVGLAARQYQLHRLEAQRAQLQWVELDCHIAWCEERIAAHVRSCEQAQAAMKLCGIGPVTASALAASVGVFRQFKTAAQFGAWLGLVPSLNSSGGKASLDGITKRADEYLRTLLLQGAKSAVMTAHKRSDRISQWLVQLTARMGWQKAVVALADKNARILWAVLAKGRRFDPNHVSVKPQGPSTVEPTLAG